MRDSARPGGRRVGSTSERRAECVELCDPGGTRLSLEVGCFLGVLEEVFLSSRVGDKKDRKRVKPMGWLL